MQHRPQRSEAGSRLIRSFQQLTMDRLDAGVPVVTLFSGGLDSSYLLHRLVRTGVRDVHAVSIDLGEDESTDDKRRIADRLGVRLHVVDGRRAFAEDFVRPAIAAQAVYLDAHPVSSSLSRPLIAQLAVGLARELGAQAVLHTACRSQNTLRRLNGAIRLLGFEGLYGSPYDLDPVDRDQKIRELKDAGLDQLSERVVSGDSNLWCREFESGILDDPENHAVPEHMYRWSAVRGTGAAAHRAHAEHAAHAEQTGLSGHVVGPGDDDPAAECVEIGFTAGVPARVDGAALPLTELIALLNERAGGYGIGRYTGLEHLGGGQKVLEVREMPAAALLLRSYRMVESAVLDAETVREKMHLEQLWVREALEGRWFGELRLAVQSFMDACAAPVTGSVRWALRPGGAESRAVRAESPRYLRDRETWERDSIRAESAAYAA
jgi:argininosuccinate synthase